MVHFSYYCGCGMGCGHRQDQYYVLVVTCDYFYGLEKLNVSMEYKFKKMLNLLQSGLSKLVALYVTWECGD